MPSIRQLLVAVVVVLVLAGLAVAGAGWKWSHGASGFKQQQLAGWTWDGAPTA
jgi:hypothetical protein